MSSFKRTYVIISVILVFLNVLHGMSMGKPKSDVSTEKPGSNEGTETPTTTNRPFITLLNLDGKDGIQSGRFVRKGRYTTDKPFITGIVQWTRIPSPTTKQAKTTDGSKEKAPSFFVNVIYKENITMIIIFALAMIGMILAMLTGFIGAKWIYEHQRNVRSKIFEQSSPSWKKLNNIPI